jgi:hypothetical protein
MKLKIKLLAKTVPGGRHFGNLAEKTDHKIQSGGLHQDVLKCLAGSQPRRADGIRTAPDVLTRAPRLVLSDCLRAYRGCSLRSSRMPA